MSLQLEDLAVDHGEPLGDGDLPAVNVVIPTLQGPQLLADCLAALLSSSYPRELLTVTVVANGSQEATRSHLARRHARDPVRLVANARNEGFTPAINRGVREGTPAPVVCFLNDDVRVERDWLRALVSPVARGDCAASAARMHLDGGQPEFTGGGANFQGIAIGHGPTAPAAGEGDFPRQCLFACGGAMAMDRSAFLDVGLLDERFFAYYDDLDLGWRTWLLGREVHYVPGALCHHARSSTSRLFPPEQMRLLQVRNALVCCLKNYGEELLERLLPVLLALAVRRAWILSAVDERPYRISEPRSGSHRGRGLFAPRPAGGGMQPLGVADVIGLNDVLGDWNGWQERRAAVQERRRIVDDAILRLFLDPLWCVETEPGYVALQRALLERSGLAARLERFTMRCAGA